MNKLDEMFDVFWNAYPKKVARARALKWWLSNKPDLELFKKIIYALRKAKETKQWQRREYIPHAITWLNQMRWEDVLEEEDMVYKPRAIPNSNIQELFNKVMSFKK